MTLRSAFSGPNGLRAGWRLAIFLILLAIPGGALLLIAKASGGGAQGPITLTPALLGLNDAVFLLALIAATWAMAKIEKRRFSQYGLPVRKAFRKDFWIGAQRVLQQRGAMLAARLLRGPLVQVGAYYKLSL